MSSSSAARPTNPLCSCTNDPSAFSGRKQPLPRGYIPSLCISAETCLIQLFTYKLPRNRSSAPTQELAAHLHIGDSGQAFVGDYVAKVSAAQVLRYTYQEHALLDRAKALPKKAGLLHATSTTTPLVSLFARLEACSLLVGHLVVCCVLRVRGGNVPRYCIQLS